MNSVVSGVRRLKQRLGSESESEAVGIHTSKFSQKAHPKGGCLVYTLFEHVKFDEGPFPCIFICSFIMQSIIYLLLKLLHKDNAITGGIKLIIQLSHN